jgi:hypothetical protein
MTARIRPTFTGHYRGRVFWESSMPASARDTPRWPPPQLCPAHRSSCEMIPKLVFGAEALDLVKLDVGALGRGLPQR